MDAILGWSHLLTLAASYIVSGLASNYVGLCFVEIWTTPNKHFWGTLMWTLGRRIWPDSTRSPIRTLFELYFLTRVGQLAANRHMVLGHWETAGVFLASAGKSRGLKVTCVFKIACYTWSRSLCTLDIFNSQLFTWGRIHTTLLVVTLNLKECWDDEQTWLLFLNC